ncbi:fatty acid hydroxylase superfamily-domain-containing protein [Dunaliella salina]|uniref:Fatty acid hydroxylase superfamily-domain-containing protein n=1 Tax=Dunaliella salina TaxID=3046 RepID=A0ABQ7G093_DUNSA|nr:fatty acid hydroxylase superfamily-domain-containing protein [Dunaliella salina]|eukprot:KAF5828019.1 fatty acid hydroxylase superfamily-domain-containing protein [Dunaliella salina]
MELQRLMWNSIGTLGELLRPHRVEFWFALSPVFTYWLLAGFYDLLDHSSSTFVAKYRIARREPEPGRVNRVSRAHVCQRVLLQHGMQLVATLAALVLDPQQCSANPPVGWVRAGLQFLIGMFIMDTWQYWIHRAMHTSRFMYKHFHSTHHQLWNPYAFGALYNHPLEALLLDTLGATICFFSLNMTCQLAVGFFCFSTAKTVLDHSNYRFPLNPLHDMFPNSAAYHDVHHDFHGLKANYSQPFFIMWDLIMGTYMDPRSLQLSPEELAAAAAVVPKPAPAIQDAALNHEAAASAAKADGGAAAPAAAAGGSSGSSNRSSTDAAHLQAEGEAPPVQEEAEGVDGQADKYVGKVRSRLHRSHA